MVKVVHTASDEIGDTDADCSDYAENNGGKKNGFPNLFYHVLLLVRVGVTGSAGVSEELRDKAYRRPNREPYYDETESR